MEALIEALTLMASRSSPPYPTGCEHDELFVYVDPALFSEAELARLGALGFTADHEEECFYSFRFGSA